MTVGGRVKIRVLEAEAYVDGNVGWGLARPEPTGWKMVQLHASLRVGNEEAFGETFEA